MIVTLSNTMFRNKLAILLRHFASPGQIKVEVVNCTFTAEVETLYQGDNDRAENYSNSTMVRQYGCNSNVHDQKIIKYDTVIFSYFMFVDTNKSNKIQFINCSFLGITDKNTIKLLEFFERFIDDGVKYLTISIINCLFYNNYNVKLLSIESYINNQFPYLSVFIINVAVLSNRFSDTYAITADNVALYIDSITIAISTFKNLSSRTSTVIGAKYSYVQFSGDNDFSLNKASFAISCPAIYLQENTVLNFTDNLFESIMNIDQPIKDDIDMCAIQYISNKGNLDNEFQQGKSSITP